MRNQIHGELKGATRRFYQDGRAAAALLRNGDPKPAEIQARRRHTEAFAAKVMRFTPKPPRQQ